MSGALWLGCYTDGKYRCGGRSARSYVRLLPHLWLQRKLDQTFGEGAANDMLAACGKPKVCLKEITIIALLLVDAQDCLHRTTAESVNWDRESELQSLYHGRPADSYELHVSDVVQLCKPQGLWACKGLTFNCQLFVSAKLSVTDGHFQTGARIFRRRLWISE